MATTQPPPRGYRLAPAPNAGRFAPATNAGRFVGTDTEPAPSRPRSARFAPSVGGGVFGPHPGSSLFAPLTGPSIDELLAGSGFAAVLERPDGKRTVLGGDDHPADGLKSLSIVLEVNNLSDFEFSIPASPDAFDWRFSDVIIGHDGQRLFHGELWPAAGSSGSQEVSLGGFGPLKRLTEGSIDFTVGEITTENTATAEDAIDAVWRAAGEFADGHVRGAALAPMAGNTVRLSADKEYSGTYLGVLKEIHADAGMIFTTDHADPNAFFYSFVPETQAVELEWQAIDYSPTVDPTGYANRIVVRGATKPGVGEQNIENGDRYSATVTAPDREIREVSFGRIITHRPPPDDSLTSTAACREHAGVLLDKARAEFQVTGSVDVPPTQARPGYVYRVPEFERAAPDIFGEVVLPLQSVEHSFGPGEASTSLAFETADGIVGAIREAVGAGPAAKAGSVTIDGDEDSNDAYSGTYPRTY